MPSDYVNELFQQFHQLRLSCDDKNKVNVGTPAVSRYHQIATFFLCGSEPNFIDHDFAYGNSKIIPSGYLIMSEKEHSHFHQHYHAYQYAKPEM